MIRYAIVRGRRDDSDVLAAYLPRNYVIVGTVTGTDGGTDGIVIAGQDNAGWTFDDYVAPRLATGGFYATELKETA